MKDWTFLMDIAMLVLFLGMLVWMVINFSRNDEKVDLALLVVRYAFQIVRFFVYIMKMSQKVKERQAIKEIAIEEEFGYF